MRTSTGNYCLSAVLPIVLMQLAGCSWQSQVPADNVPVRISPANVADADEVRSQVATTAMQMVGAPYQYGGFTPKGFDCSGLVYYSYRKAGLTVPRTSGEQLRQPILLILTMSVLAICYFSQNAGQWITLPSI